MKASPTCYNLSTDLLSVNETGRSYLQESNVNNNFVLIENCVEFPLKTSLPNLICFIVNLMNPINKVVMKKESLILKFNVG